MFAGVHSNRSRFPLTRAILYLRRGEAFFHSRAYDLVHKDINQAPLLTPPTPVKHMRCLAVRKLNMEISIYYLSVTRRR